MSEEKKDKNDTGMATLARKYNVSLMTIQQSRDLVAQSFKFSPNVVPLLIGEAGVGKTDIIKSIAKERESNCLVMKLANMEKEDMTGYIHLTNDGESFRFVPHENMKKTLESNPNTVIFFDEINRGDFPTIKAFFNVIDERRFGDYPLGDGVRLVAAMNPANKNYNVNDILAEAALRKRFRVICCRVDSGTYINYVKNGTEEKGHPVVIEYLETHPTAVYNHRALEMGQVFSSPHGWSRISNSLFRIEKSDKDWMENINKYTPLFAGDVNVAEAETFATFIRDINVAIRPGDVLYDYKKKAKKKVMATIKRNRNDILSELIDSVCIYTVSEEPDVTKIAEGISDFMGDLPDDMFMKFITKFTSECKTKDPEIKYQTSLNEELTKSKYTGFKSALERHQATNDAIENSDKEVKELNENNESDNEIPF